MTYFKIFFSALFLMVICSSNVWADLPLPMSGFGKTCIGNNFLGNNLFNGMTETQEALLTGDFIVFFGFLLWIAYIVFCMPKNTFKKL